MGDSGLPPGDGGIVGDTGVPPGDDAGQTLEDAGQDAAPLGVDAGALDARAPVHLGLWEVWMVDLSNFRAAGSPEAYVTYPDGTTIWSGPTTPVVVTGPCSTGAGQLPANCITWNEAFALCAFLGQRMPTMDEWLAESGVPGPWEITDGTAPRSSIRGDHPCDQSIALICDAHGNVSEWVVDGGNVAMGEAYDDARSMRVQTYPSADIGVRCWGAAR